MFENENCVNKSSMSSTKSCPDEAERGVRKGLYRNDVRKGLFINAKRTT